MPMSTLLMIVTIFVKMMLLFLGTLLITVTHKDVGAKIVISDNTVDTKIMSSQVLSNSKIMQISYTQIVFIFRNHLPMQK